MEVNLKLVHSDDNLLKDSSMSSNGVDTVLLSVMPARESKSDSYLA